MHLHPKLSSRPRNKLSVNKTRLSLGAAAGSPPASRGGGPAHPRAPGGEPGSAGLTGAVPAGARAERPAACGRRAEWCGERAL